MKQRKHEEDYIHIDSFACQHGHWRTVGSKAEEASPKGYGDCGEETLFILTSTDNKDTGAASYDNLQKSINGFNRQIGKLLNSEYKDSDLETAKRTLKADMLNNESVISKMASLAATMELDEDLTYDNRRFEMIDSITREDIDKMAKKVFADKPVYSIVASQDTLDYNSDYLSKIAE